MSLSEYRRKRDPAAPRSRSRRRRPRQTADLRRPAPRRPAPALRLPPGTERRARVVGGAEGCSARARRAGAGGARRGSPTRLRDIPRRDPAGPYGAGSVEIWDKGAYELLEEKPNGQLTVALRGKRLRGTWTLVPAHLDGKEQNWLLIRNNDEAPEDRRPTASTARCSRPRRAAPARATAGCSR